MQKPWMLLMLLCSMLSLAGGRADDAVQGILAAGEEAVNMTLTLMGAMTLWGGLMEILQETGDVKRLAHLFRKVVSPLFRGVEDEAAWSSMGLNLAANLMGLGNAATPAGIDAAKRLSNQGEAGMRGLAMLLVMNNSGLQLMPTTMITLRQAAGSRMPGAVWLPTMIASSVSMVVGVLLMMIVQRGGRRR
ncbi:MAG: hypothetical protein E7327_08800 [Clostridiales bacterium]|nr:hypothetical protein [Clostridiales bacterium]